MNSCERTVKHRSHTLLEGGSFLLPVLASQVRGGQALVQHDCHRPSSRPRGLVWRRCMLSMCGVSKYGFKHQPLLSD